MLHGVDLRDSAETHLLCLGKGLLRKNLFQLSKGFCAGYQKAAASRDLRPGKQERSGIVAVLQKRAMLGHQFGKLLERHEILPLQQKMLHDAELLLSLCN